MNKLAGETVLITGGAGLIGSRVARFLVERGYRVVVFDPFVQYVSPFQILIKDYLERRFSGIEEEIIFERGDTTNVSHARKIIERHDPQYIVHLAAMPLADLSNKHVEEAVASILIGAINVLEIAKDLANLRRFVYASSSMVYGDFQEVPCPEEHPKNPKDVYGGSKYAGEVMTRTFGHRFNLPYTIIRPSAVYGPYDINRRVSQIFVERALQGRKLRLDGAGAIELDFTYVDDLAHGLILALLSDEAENETFNITFGRGYTLLEFARILQGIIPSTEYYLNETKDDFRPVRGALAIDKAREKLGYNPEFSLEKGLKKYVKVYDNLGLGR